MYVFTFTFFSSNLHYTFDLFCVSASASCLNVFFTECDTFICYIYVLGLDSGLDSTGPGNLQDSVALGPQMLEKSPEAISLGIKEFSSPLLMAVLSQMEACLWHIYHRAGEKQNSEMIVVAGPGGKKFDIFAKYPIDPNTQIPFAGRLSLTKSKGSIFFAKVFGVSFYIEQRSEFSGDVLVPAWSCKTVTSQEKAFFVQKTKTYRLSIQLPHQFTGDAEPVASEKVDGENKDRGSSGKPFICTHTFQEKLRRMVLNLNMFLCYGLYL